MGIVVKAKGVNNMRKGKKAITVLLIFALCFSFNLSVTAAEQKNFSAETTRTNYPPVTIGNRVGYGEAYGKGKVNVYVTLDQSYSKGIVVRAGAVGNDSLYSCSVVYPNGTVRVLCSQELNNLYANGDKTDYFYISNGSAGTYQFIFSMQNTTKTTGCVAWIYEVTGYL